MYRIRSIFLYGEYRDTFSGEVRYFLLVFFLSVPDFVFILLELVVGILWSVGWSRVGIEMDIVAFLDQQRVVSASSWVGSILF